MDFRLNDEQRMMSETARQIGERFGLEYGRKQEEQQATDDFHERTEHGMRGLFGARVILADAPLPALWRELPL